MSRSRALRILADGLHGRADDWMALITAANGALVTPALREALAADEVPEDAAAFMDLIVARNDERNQRLRAMLLDATALLNRAGVTPIYLKGMAIWAACRPNASSYPRMMSDVDLMVRLEETQTAIEVLTAGGFKILEQHGEHLHAAADLYRDGDVGVLDLHRRPPGPSALAALGEADTVPAPWPGEARMPSPAHQIYLICLHDMLHDAGFWRGGFDIRHLCDIAELARHPQGVDWELLMSLPPTRLTRNAVLSQLLAAHRITAAPIPARLLGGVLPGLHHGIHRAQHLAPALGLPLALLSMGLEAFNLRQHWPHRHPDVASLRDIPRLLAQRAVLPNKI